MEHREIRPRAETSQKKTFSELFSQLRRELVLFLEDFWRKEDSYLASLETKYVFSKDLSRAAGELCGTFFQNRKDASGETALPQKKERDALDLLYKDRRKMYLHVKQYIKKCEREQKITLDEQARTRQAQETIESIESEDLVRDIYIEKKRDVTEEKIFNTFLRHDRHNLIEEYVYNEVTPISNKSMALIFVRNRDTGVVLSVQDLLPSVGYLNPDQLFQYEVDAHIENNAVKNDYTPISQSLKDYQGTKGNGGDFSASLGGRVSYGDLTSDGGLLSLFHEITHAWQNARVGKYARGNFKEFQKTISVKLRVLKYFQEKVENGSCSQEDFDTIVLKDIEQELGDIGVEFDQFDYSGDRPLRENEWRIRERESSCIVKSQKLPELIKDYEQEERDAWAGALRLLRFLRRRGFDVEPNLNTFEKVREYIDSSLGTYQEGMERAVESPTRKIQFTKRPKVK